MIDFNGAETMRITSNGETLVTAPDGRRYINGIIQQPEQPTQEYNHYDRPLTTEDQMRIIRELIDNDRARDAQQRLEDAVAGRLAEANAPDRFMRKALREFEEKKAAFAAEIYSTDQIMERREARLELYRLCDAVTEESKKFYKESEDKEEKLTLGTDADHQARYKDWLKSNDGKITYKRTLLSIFYEEILAKIADERKKKKIFGLFLSRKEKERQEVYTRNRL
jgi:hypothetical protein